MCIKRYDFDEALLCVKPHAPKCAATIEQYVEQLERDKAEMLHLLKCADKENTSATFGGAGAWTFHCELGDAITAILERSK